MDSKSFTTRYTGRANRLVTDVGIAIAFGNDEQRPTHTHTYKALWDTGATNTLVTQRVVTECNLTPRGFSQVYTPSGSHESSTFFVSVWLPNRVIVPQVVVTQGSLANNIDLLIGMDIIGLGDFAVNNKDGVTSFSFRIPSMERVDYTVRHQTLRMTPPIGRNSLCPCGSGKKYKHCHGQNVSRSQR